jgi:Mn2+/Fe2+ NRAMP family transporter
MTKFTNFIPLTAPLLFGVAAILILFKYDGSIADFFVFGLSVFLWFMEALKSVMCTAKNNKAEQGLKLIRNLAEQDSDSFGGARKDIAVIAKSTLEEIS